MKNLTRREFVNHVLGGTLLAGMGALPPLAGAQPVPRSASLPRRPLGKTGFQVGIFSLGGEALLEQPGTLDESERLIGRALDLGVNYIDTSPIYNESEIAIGRVMATRRKEVFLASKTHDRSYDGSMRLLERSLKRLQTDHLDLWQIHNIRTAADIDFIFSREGVIKAMERAREEGLVSHVGVTGHHDPAVLRTAIERHPFDTVLAALNAADRHSNSFIDTVIPAAAALQMGIIAMKVVSRGKIFQKEGLTTMAQALGYALSLPVSTAIIGLSTIKELEENVRLARDFSPFSKEEMKRLEDLTKSYHREATWYKTEW